MISKKLRRGYRFRHYTDNYGKKPGLYFENVMDHPRSANRLHEKEIIEIRDWLSRYINRFIHKNNVDLAVESRAHARAILRNIDQIEAEKCTK